MRTELAIITGATARPFNVNFFCHTPPQPDTQREAAWRDLLRPYYDELGIDIDDVPAAGGAAAVLHEAADMLSEFRPPVVSFHFGLPAPICCARPRMGARR